MSKTTFKPQFLFKDEVAIKQEAIKVATGVKHLNDFITQIESALSVKLTNNERQTIQETGLRLVFEKLRANYEFPKATHEFNMQALGIDTKLLEKFYERFEPTWSSYKYKLDKDGQFAPDKATIKKAQRKHIYNTTNENQNLALILAKDLEFSFAHVEGEGHLKKYNRALISDVTGLLEYSFDEHKKLRVQPDYYYIRQIK